MRKLTLMLLIVLGSMTAFKAAAQTPTQAYGVAISYSSGVYVTIQNFTFGITSSQPPALFQPANVFTNAGTFVDPSYIFILGGYWTTPTLSTPLQISIGAGYYAVVQNDFPTVSQNVRISVRFANSNGSGSTTIAGSLVTIPAGGTATIPIPQAAATYTNGTIPSLRTDPTYQVPVSILIEEY